MSIIRREEVCKRLSISATTLLRWIHNGDFPQPIRLGPARVGWLEKDVLDWIEARHTQSGSDA